MNRCRRRGANDDFALGRITAADLRAVEDAEILAAIGMQEEVGLQSATDGEFRRTSWHVGEMARLGKLGCTCQQFDDTSLAYLNDPAQWAEIAGAARTPGTCTCATSGRSTPRSRTG